MSGDVYSSLPTVTPTLQYNPLESGATILANTEKAQFGKIRQPQLAIDSAPSRMNDPCIEWVTMNCYRLQTRVSYSITASQLLSRSIRASRMKPKQEPPTVIHLSFGLSVCYSLPPSLPWISILLKAFITFVPKSMTANSGQFTHEKSNPSWLSILNEPLSIFNAFRRG